MKKYLYSSLLVLAGGVLLANTTVAYADSPSASEKEAIAQLVNQGKIKAEEADQVKLIGFEDKETQAEGNQEKKAFNQYRDPKGTWMQTNGNGGLNTVQVVMLKIGNNQMASGTILMTKDG